MERAAREPENEDLAYFVRLATFHEDMHAEAFTYERQTLEYGHEDYRLPELVAWDLDFERQKHALGAKPGSAFVFDNKKWAHEVEVGPFAIASSPVTNAEYLVYVEAGGKIPRYWKNEGGRSWFGDHKVLRGGSFAAPARPLRRTFRNFYRPHRGDIFRGFRTCALG